MKNRFNNITSKEWLPFQKSWFRYTGYKDLLRSNLRFFIKFDMPNAAPNVLYWGSPFQHESVRTIADQEGARIFFADQPVPEVDFQLILVDLLSEITDRTTPEQFKAVKKKLLGFLNKHSAKLTQRRFVAVFLRNTLHHEIFRPYAWDLAGNLSEGLSLKDEKIACLEHRPLQYTSSVFKTDFSVFYALYFRKDEQSLMNFTPQPFAYTEGGKALRNKRISFQPFPSWQIIKPRPRKKNEILHPAKYPEELIEQFIAVFTQERDNVLDPMSGTGSTQVAALRMNRNGYGTELSPFFAEIANTRCKEVLNPQRSELFSGERKTTQYKILNKNAREINVNDFPAIDYIITSPPYWDMLNMKGAEYQARRKEKGLQLNYSDNPDDLGNINNYQAFLNELTTIYLGLLPLLKTGGYFTIIVKNIKKKGRNYPFAWQLSQRLQKHLSLLPESFWLQDDIPIAPYGYGNTWVSNTFHQYCLTFQKNR